MSIRVVNITKATPTAGIPSPDVAIQISGELPEVRGHAEAGWLEKWSARLDDEAERLEDALIHALPGGVYDRLLARMMARKVTHFGVPHLEVEPK